MTESNAPTPLAPWLDAQHAQDFGQLQTHWLLRPGALTAGLRTLGSLHLIVLREYASTLSDSEAWMIQAKRGSATWVREIYMSIDGIPCVTARSFTRLEDSKGCWRGIRGLANRPLADMLYHNPNITRSPFWVCALGKQDPLYNTVVQTAAHTKSPVKSAQPLLARCSTFWYQNHPLLVAECFLPQFWSIAQRSART